MRLYRRYYEHGYTQGLEFGSQFLGWSPPLNKRQQAAFERGLAHGKHDREAIQKDLYFISKLEVKP